ncbi:MAG: hypothetical protein ACLUEK_08975 [Oscillospiraceae bacterium]
MRSSKRRELRHGARAARLAFAPISEGERGPGRGLLGRAEIASVRIVYSEDVEVDRELKLTPGERFLRFWVLTRLSAPFYLE